MIEAKVRGIPDLREALRSLPDKLRKRALRNALAAGARLVRGVAKQAAPVLPAADLAVRRGVRRPGTVRNAISVRTSKLARRKGDVGVFVNVRPAKPGQRGNKSPTDPFYWRFLEFGWNPAGAATGGQGKAGQKQRRALNKSGAPKARSGAEYLQKGAGKLGEALQIFIAKIRPAIAKLNQPKAPAP